MKKIFIISFVGLAMVAAGAKSLSKNPSAQAISPLQKLGYAEQIIENFYVDSVDENKIVEEAIVAMLKTLDPHSTYTDPEQTKSLTTPLQGNFSGIGIQFNMVNDSLYVIQTTAGGPSEKVGILPGDRIISANDSVLSGVKRKNDDILKILRGPKGTEVTAYVVRKGVKDPIKFRIIRDDIPLYSVDAAYVIDPNIGYIRVSRFAGTTAEEVAEALEKFKAQGVEDIIIDLEDNGGGYLNAAVDLASLFLPQNSLITYTDGPRVDRTNYYAKGKPLFPDGRLVVLVNQNSASSSEIFSGAIQDYDRGVIIGRRTFGKGLVQRPFDLPDGSMIRLTISKYFTPTGRSIQKPYKNGASEDYYKDMYNRYKDGEFMSADSIHFDESLKVSTINKGRTVYGGGGIMPDVFVPIDTTGYSTYYRDLTANGIYNRFVVNYIDQHRKELKKAYPTAESFIAGFEVTPDLMKSFTDFGEKEGVKLDEEGLETSREVITALIKGLIARDLWEMDDYFKVMNPVISPIYMEAIEVLKDRDRYEKLLNP